MKAKIKSTVTKIATRENGMAFLSREIVKLNFDLISQTFQSVIREEKFILVNGERLVVEPVKILKPTPITTDKVNELFSSINSPIQVSDLFCDKFSELMQKALLLETQNYNEDLYGILPNEWVVDND